MSDIYMEYLTEDARENLILEKEMDLISTDIDYLFTTYEAVDNDKKKGILIRIIDKVRLMIKKIKEILIPKLLNKIKKKKEIKVTNNDSNNAEKTKALPSPNPENYKEKIYIKNGLEMNIKESDKMVNMLWKYEEKLLKIVYNNKYDEEKISESDIDDIKDIYAKISTQTFNDNRPEVLCQNKNIISSLNKTIENINHISIQADSGLSKLRQYILNLEYMEDGYVECHIISDNLNDIMDMCRKILQLYNKFLDNIRIEYVAK